MALAGRSLLVFVSLLLVCAVQRCLCQGGQSMHHGGYLLAEKSKELKTVVGHPAAAPLAELSGHQGGSHKHRVPKWTIIGGSVSVVGSLAVFVSGLLLFRPAIRCIRERHRTRPGIMIFTPRFISRAEHLAFLEEEEEDVLASLEVIGRGGCGEVYKAQLPVERKGAEPRSIAIKRVVKHSNGDAHSNLSDIESRHLDRWSRQVQSEIRTVGHIRHRNLLPLAAHVPRPNCHYLVYEYMKNGSLQDALKVKANGGSGAITGLPWPARIRVAVGIAEGLEYLHFSHHPQIIHRDLKPANILLDDDMEPRITDFGLAKAIPDMHTHVTASCVAGTLGYIAPEYHQTLKFTAKCDVYSLGVILAVLATGRRPSDHFSLQVDDDVMDVRLVKWLRRVLQGSDPAVAIDPDIAGAGFDEHIVLVLRIAVLCTQDDPKDRPTAKEVRCMLSQI